MHHIAPSWTWVPELSPREIQVALPAAPAAAIASMALMASWGSAPSDVGRIGVVPDEDVVVEEGRAPERLDREPVRDELCFAGRRVGQHRVGLAGPRIGQRRTRPRRVVLQRVLRIGGLEAGLDHVLDQARIRRVGRALDPHVARAGRRGHEQEQRSRRRAARGGRDGSLYAWRGTLAPDQRPDNPAEGRESGVKASTAGLWNADANGSEGCSQRHPAEALQQARAWARYPS